MSFFKRIISVIALFLLGTLILYGGTLVLQKKAEDKPQTAFNREETLYFWYTDESMTQFVNSAAVTFGEKEQVRVIPMLTSGNEYLERIYDASIEGKQFPDVYLLGHDQLEKAYLSGVASKIEDVSAICTDYYFPKAAISSVTYHDEKIAYPLSFETSILLYNEDYLLDWARQRAYYELTHVCSTDPETGEETESLIEGYEPSAEEIRVKTEECFARAIPGSLEDILFLADTFDVPEQVEGIMKWDVSDIFYNYWIVGDSISVGGECGDEENTISINNEKTLACLQAYTALNQFFYIEPESVTYESVVQDFLEGKIVYTIATSDIISRLQEAENRGELNFRYGISTMPDVSSELPGRSMSTTNCVVINGFSEHSENANKFAAFLVKNMANSFYEKTGKLPALLGAEGGTGMADIFRLEYADSIPLPKMMKTSNYWVILERVFSKAWQGVDVTALLQEMEILTTY